MTVIALQGMLMVCVAQARCHGAIAATTARAAMILGLLGACIIVGFASPISARCVYNNPVSVDVVRVLTADRDSITLAFEAPAVNAIPRTLPGFGTGHIFRALNTGYLAKVGCPDLPAYRRMVRIPPTGGVELEVLSEDTLVLGLYDVPPFQPLPKRDTAPPPYCIREDIYCGHVGIQAYPSTTVEIESINILRDIRVAWLRFHPVRYNPVTGEVIVTIRATVSLRFGATDVQGPRCELLRTPSGVTQSFLPLYKHVLGLESTGDLVASESTGDLAAFMSAENFVAGCYLCISTAQGIELVEDLITWKRKRGYHVQIGLIPEIGSTPSEIDDWIEEAFSTWANPPEWILLVGGEDMVPPPLHNGFAADNIYGVVGDGTVPSIHVGRLTGEDSGDLHYQAWKIRKHESDPYQPPSSWFEHAISIGSADFGDPESSWMYAEIFMAAGMTVDWFCPVGGGLAPTVPNIAASINDGCSLISYIGHGSLTRWGTSNFSNTDISNLINGRMLPWISSIACNNGYFNDGNYCFAEAWMSEGNIADPKGGIGVLAATTASPEGPTQILAEHTFRGYFEEDIHHMGAAVDYAKMKVFELYGLGDEDNNMMHMVFGCPELDIYCESSPLPQLVGTHEDSIAEGSFEIIITAGGNPIEGALVGAFQYQELLDGARTDGTGTVVLAIPPFPAGSATVEITATAHNRVPYCGTANPMLSPQAAQPARWPRLWLEPACPNPFSTSTQVAYYVPAPGSVRLDLFDSSGRLIRSLVCGEHGAGDYNVVWDGRNASGRRVPAGLYVLRLTGPYGTAERSCVILR